MSSRQFAISDPAIANRWTIWRHIIAGLSANLIGIGLARFAYTPLIPPLIKAQWFSADDVVYLSAANLAGYLIGAMIGRPIAKRLGNVTTLRSMKVMVTLSFLACAFPLSVPWFFSWRLLSGVGGGAIMVLVAATILPHVPNHRRAAASGAVFLGLGLGIAASGTLVPLLLQYGLQATWIGLALLSAILTAASWNGWPRTEPDQVLPSPTAGNEPRAGLEIGLLYVVYALMALGLVAPMVFLVDCIARGLHAGEHVGAYFWVLYGVGAICGPPSYAYITDRLGASKALRVLLVCQAVALAGLATTHDFVAIGILTIFIGSFPPGNVPLMLGWVREIYPNETTRQNILWGRATTVYATFQALAGYFYSVVFTHSDGNYWLLFRISAGMIIAALLLEYFVPKLAPLKRPAAG